MKKSEQINKYIKSKKIPKYHNLSLSGTYLKMSYQDLYIVGDMVFNNFDKFSGLKIKDLTILKIKKTIDNFILVGEKRSRTRPYQLAILNDIDNIGYENIWDFQYSDCGKKDRYLNNEGRHQY